MGYDKVLKTAGITLLATLATAQAAESTLDFEDEATRVNYSLGYQIGGDFKRQNVEINADAVIRGIEDALSGAIPQMPPDQMHATLVELKRRVVDDLRNKRRANELAVVEESEAFLAENATRDDVVTTDSGLQYRIVEPGSDVRPEAYDMVVVNYQGTLVNGNEFDSGESASFTLDRVIPGWTEGLQLIGEGGRIELFVPTKLAYRDRGPMAHRALIFDVELLEVRPRAEDDG